MASKKHCNDPRASEAGKNLQNPNSSKDTKSKAGKDLERHQKKYH